MWKQIMLVFCAGVVATYAAATAGAASQHTPTEGGLQLVTRFVRHYLDQQPADVTLAEGVHLVRTEEGRAATADGDSGLLSTLERYLRTHELRVRLPDAADKVESVGRALRQAMDEYNTVNDLTEARAGKIGKKGKGSSIFLLMALMMGKTLAAIGFGTVGLLAMKALMVSALALMLSIIIGLKKLLGGGHEESHGHTVIHATAGGHEIHRRKRDAADMAYHAWSNYLNR